MSDDFTFDDLPQPDYEGTVPTDDLDTDGENPNEQNDETFGLLCERMRGRGWLGGPIVTDTDGLIADGEHRWRAAQEIGLEEVPVKQYEFTDAERRMVRQELNKISGEHDTKRDALEYDYLLDAGKSDEVHDLTTAAEEDLDELLAEIKVDTGQPAEYEYDPDHSVYFEDCIEGMRDRLEDDSVDMVFTSPPYNVGDFSTADRSTDPVAYSDDRDEHDYREFIGSVGQELARVTKPDGHVFINIGIRNATDPTIFPEWIIDTLPLPLRSVICWHKDFMGLGSSQQNMNHEGKFYQMWEPIFHFSESPRPLTSTNNYGVWPIRPETDVTDHPAAFPVALPTEAIQTTTAPGETVLDPFMGTGTTAVAAIQNDRDYVGFELDEEGAYQPIVERRIGEAKRAADASVNRESGAENEEASGDD